MTHSLTLALALEFGFGGDLESLEPPVLSDGDLDMFNRGVRQEDHLVLARVQRDAGVARRYPFDVEVAAGCGRDDDPHGKRIPFHAESLDAESELPHEELAVEHDAIDDRRAGTEDVAPLRRWTVEVDFRRRWGALENGLVQRGSLTSLVIVSRRGSRERAASRRGRGGCLVGRAGVVGSGVDAVGCDAVHAAWAVREVRACRRGGVARGVQATRACDLVAEARG